MWAFVMGLLKALFGAILKTPREPDKEDFRDVGREQPYNPDDAFDPSDFDD